MKDISTLEQVRREVELMPKEYLPDIFRFLHYFRLGLGDQPRKQDHGEQILKFAGSWDNWNDAEFEDFLHDTTKRRQTAFKKRRGE